jgi:hypothetical protein
LTGVFFAVELVGSQDGRTTTRLIVGQKDRNNHVRRHAGVGGVVAEVTIEDVECNDRGDVVRSTWTVEAPVPVEEAKKAQADGDAARVLAVLERAGAEGLSVSKMAGKPMLDGRGQPVPGHEFKTGLTGRRLSEVLKRLDSERRVTHNGKGGHAGRWMLAAFAPGPSEEDWTALAEAIKDAE